ncbi:unnamed protein product [Eruca vesicaria subsp. sativa]|uniref:Uncharacterized protein n=1 Tax=Eruca vesicaria subsp. sativa TaxID=29727 RepID=A0ABC8JGT4_ERUVS|nr:unnamed protein product [Eruca vesicaria subsp. sativa]
MDVSPRRTDLLLPLLLPLPPSPLPLRLPLRRDHFPPRSLVLSPIQVAPHRESFNRRRPRASPLLLRPFHGLLAFHLGHDLRPWDEQLFLLLLLSVRLRVLLDLRDS